MAAGRDNTELAYDQRIARWVARYLAVTSLTPNIVTSASILSGLYAAYLLAEGAWRRILALLSSYSLSGSIMSMENSRGGPVRRANWAIISIMSRP